jgi:hypothetical protein
MAMEMEKERDEKTMGKQMEYNEDFDVELEVKNGYYSLPAKVVAAVNRYFRGGTFGVYYAGKISYCHAIKEISRGFLYEWEEDIPAMRDEILRDQVRLREMLEENKAIALSCVKKASNFYAYREGNNAIIYVHCSGDDTNNIMGFGWNGGEGHGSSKKAALIVGVIMYALGELNRKKDPEFYFACHNFLPYDLEYVEPDDFDVIIRNTLGTGKIITGRFH